MKPADQIPASNQCMRQADKAAHLAVGEFLVKPYGEAHSIVTQLRKLKDGRRWSLLPDESGEYRVWRRA